jgi:hypothetical protein
LQQAPVAARKLGNRDHGRQDAGKKASLQRFVVADLQIGAPQTRCCKQPSIKEETWQLKSP